MEQRQLPLPQLITDTDAACPVRAARLSVMDVALYEEPRMTFVRARFDNVPFPVDWRIPLEDTLDEVPDAVAPETHLSNLRPHDNRVVRNNTQDLIDVLGLDGVAERVQYRPGVTGAQLVGIWQLTPVPARPQ